MTAELTIPYAPVGPVAVLLAAFSLPRMTRVVDIGANPMVSDAPYTALLRMGACDVVGFEPQPEAFAALADRKSNRETYFPFAVGDGSKKTLRIYRSNGFASVYDPYIAGASYLGSKQWYKIQQRMDFDTVALDHSAEIGAIDLLKIDIQGGECDVFRGAERTLKHTMAVIVELRYYRLYEGEPMLGGVDQELRRQGFYLHKFLFNKAKALPSSQLHRLKDRRHRDQLIDGDGVYLRDMARMSDYSAEQLMHLCVVAAAVFESHSLVLHCLDELVRRGDVASSLPSAYVDGLPADLKADVAGAPVGRPK